MKTCAPELATPLAKLFQYSYNPGIYLTMWKIAQVYDAHKRQDKSNAAKYHLISLLSIIIKVTDGVNNSSIKQHLLSNNLLAKWHTQHKETMTLDLDVEDGLSRVRQTASI
eukprot:g36970.t1